MRVGIDFDNTIVCYDMVFHRAAAERGLIPAGLDPSKGRVRDYLRQAGREDDWTELQGHVYGERMDEVEGYPGALACLATWSRAGIPLYIISHKTRSPYLGRQLDLHRAALAWLEGQGFFDPRRIMLPRERVFFELTKQAKLERIAKVGCTHFVDDLPEFLAEPGFPADVVRILFDPHEANPGERRFRRVGSWAELQACLLHESAGWTAVGGRP
jgi:FMN phosphatase YigB (HAD superfamily)